MKKLGRMMIVLMFGMLLLSGCVQPETEQKEEQPEITVLKLSEIDGYRLEDYTDLGLWSLTFEKKTVEALENNGMTTLTLETGNASKETFAIERHKVNHALYICFIPEHIRREAIEQAVIKKSDSRNTQPRDVLTIEKVIIGGTQVQNGTNTYEMSLEDYLQLKDDISKTSRVYKDGNLIRPTWIKSSEENAYTLQRYYDARQAATQHTPAGALTFLKDRSVSAHNDLLYFGNANRLSVTGEGVETIEAPDERKRLRELGSEGDGAGYQLTVNGENTQIKIWSQNLTGDAWHDAGAVDLEIKGLNGTNEILPRGMEKIYEKTVLCTNKERIRNARVTEQPYFDNGSGTVEDPYQITSWLHLNNVRYDMGETAYFTLKQDLTKETAYYEDYAATTTENPKGWEPIGTNSNRFQGIFNGYEGSATHTISDLCIARPGEASVGLFGVVENGAAIKNLRLKNVDVQAWGNAGGLVGENYGRITTVCVAGKVQGNSNTGGLVGLNSGQITNAWATGKVQGYGNVGGLVGLNSGGEITNAYATGEVQANEYAGGFVGINSGQITNAWAAVKVPEGGTAIGGFVGYNEVVSATTNGFTNAFWDTTESGTTNGVGENLYGNVDTVTGKTTEEMKQKGTFVAAGWTFGEGGIWDIVEDNGQKSYPYLRLIPQDPAPGLE